MNELKIIFENDDVLVIDKPGGLVVNRSQTLREVTLQDLISRYLGLAGGDLGVGDRAGIVHRLDRETSGVIVVAKRKKAFEFLQKQFAKRQVKKEYRALVHNLIPENEGEIKSKIGRIGKFGKFGEVEDGREAESSFKVLKRLKFKDKCFEGFVGGFNKGRINYLKKQAEFYSLVSFSLKTGRTHQIRVQAKSLGNPVVSDLIYAPRKLIKFDLLWCPRLFLHSKSLAIRLPGKQNQVVFESVLPYDLVKSQEYLEELPDGGD